MNLKSVLILSLIFSSLFFLTCKTDTESEQSQSELPEGTKAKQGSSGGILSHKIPNADAELYIRQYKEYIEKVDTTLDSIPNGDGMNTDSKLVFGARVDLLEILEIIKDAKPQDQLFVMMGLMENDTTEAIFALNTHSTDEWTFYDFTQPCPTACPGYTGF